jgi:hypothetical protein
MSKPCKRTENGKLALCEKMEKEINSKIEFEKAMYHEKEFIFLNVETFVDFCPFCGGELRDD